MKSFVKILFAGILTGGLLLAGFVGFRYLNCDDSIFKKTGSQSEPTGMPQPTVSIQKIITDTSNTDVSGVVNSVMPALVSIQVTVKTTVTDIFGFSHQETGAASGSGVIVAQNGSEILIATNNHVVEDATDVKVSFVDGTTATAEVKGTEPENDLAVVSVKLKNITAVTAQEIRIATLGSSEDLVPGQMVIAIGNALGYGQSVTVGYISALNREVTIDNYTYHLIQTDVAINPGNSGGALLNSRGEVIGINNAKLSEVKVEGICYAIPISTAIPVIEELMSYVQLDDSESAGLGIKGQVVQENQSSIIGMPQGIYVTSVVKDSAADKAGIKKGMIITKVNGKNVATQSQFEKVMAGIPADSEGTVTVYVLRKGVYEEETINIVFGHKSK